MRHYRQRMRRRGGFDVDVTPFLSLMVILVPFLLISAVFSRITILELQGVSQQALGPVSQDSLQLQVIVRNDQIEVSHSGRALPMVIRRSEDGGELDELSRLMVELKRVHPQSAQATILLEPQVSYDILVQVMDSVRVRLDGGGDGLRKTVLFPAIALAETPAVAAAGREHR